MFGSLAFLQVIQRSKQWWLVRNNLGEEGNIPPNVLNVSNRSMGREEQLVSEVMRSSAE